MKSVATILLTLAIIATLPLIDATLTESVVVPTPSKESPTASNSINERRNSTEAWIAAASFLQGFNSL
jgi:hypothetical protein